MKLIHIPPTGDIELVDVPLNEYELPEIFDGHITERVRFTKPHTMEMYWYQDTEVGREQYVVMLVNEDGIPYGLPVNHRASRLYQGGRHTAHIYGDAYLALETRDPMEGDIWSSIKDPYDDVEFWNAQVRR